MSNISNLFICFFRFQATLKMIHFATDSYAIHEASDKLHKSFLKRSDKFVEIYIASMHNGGSGGYHTHPLSSIRSINLSTIDVIIEPLKIAQYCKKTITQLNTIAKKLSMKKDYSQELVNVLNDMVEDIRQFVYLLYLK